MILQPIVPFEPVASEFIPVGSDWIYQIKWDGVRIITYYDGENISLFNRKLNERTFHYPEITSHIAEYFKGKSVIFDGEVIALDKNGKPSFHEVMRRDGLRNLDKVRLVKDEVPIYYMIFDILYFNGNWINERPLKDRLAIIESCVTPNKNIQIVPSQHDGDGLWKVVEEYQLEGMVCKNLNSPYRLDGKDNSWQKVKNYHDLIAVIAGVTYRAGTVNSVLLGLYDDDKKLWYIGHCGTGKMTGKDWKDLTIQTDSLKIDAKPFYNDPERMKGVQWIRPQITVKVQFIEWPEGRTLRQPSLQAITTIPASECKLPQKKSEMTTKTKTRTKPKVKKKVPLRKLEMEITHPEKPLWENPSVNKKKYLSFLQGIYPYIKPFLTDRLLTVIRYPHGMFGEPFYQKNCPEYAPNFVDTFESEGINYIVCNNEETFLWLGNQLAFEYHIPFKTIHSIGTPSEIVFDLDPPPSKNAFSLAIKAAIMIKEVLDRLNLISFVKTSGNKGLQVYIPLPESRYTFDDTRLFTSFIANYLTTQDPDSFTTERMKKNRGGRLYVDYVQHAEGKTIIAPYSPRGTQKATVATPLYWTEVNESLKIESFQIPTLFDRLKTKGDPFADYFPAKKRQNFDPVLQFLKNQSST
ncbi:DNA ligase D [Niallia sp. XMNu-256]|uniref:DNA ligase D n=1 Tax=Niallia sp. XMNu-256 TaxID=3082444 RepID=UPI0030CED6AC